MRRKEANEKQVCDGQRSRILEFNLKKRKYIGTTSMDAEVSLLMANQALARPGSLVYDPFGAFIFKRECARTRGANERFRSGDGFDADYEFCVRRADFRKRYRRATAARERRRRCADPYLPARRFSDLSLQRRPSSPTPSSTASGIGFSTRPSST